VALREQARDDRSPPQPALLDDPFRALAGLGRSNAVQGVALGDEQRRPWGAGNSSELVENIRPNLRLEATLIDPVDELGIHGLSPIVDCRAARLWLVHGQIGAR
jgi:hypothetical protein